MWRSAAATGIVAVVLVAPVDSEVVRFGDDRRRVRHAQDGDEYAGATTPGHGTDPHPAR